MVLRGFLSASARFKLLLLLDLLQDLSSVDLYLLEDVGLVGFGLDLNCLVDHLAEFPIALVQFAIALHKGIIAGCVRTVFIFQLEDASLQISDLVGELLLVFCEFLISPGEFIVDTVTFLQCPVRFLQLLLRKLRLLP